MFFLPWTRPMASASPQMAHLITSDLTVPFFSTQFLSKFLCQKHFSEPDRSETGRYSKLSQLVFAANIPLVLEKRVRTSVCTEIRKVFRSVLKTNYTWSGESPKDSFPQRRGGYLGLYSHRPLARRPISSLKTADEFKTEEYICKMLYFINELTHFYKMELF